MGSSRPPCETQWAGWHWCPTTLQSWRQQGDPRLLTLSCPMAQPHLSLCQGWCHPRLHEQGGEGMEAARMKMKYG